MPIARARLFGELTVQQLVQELASEWGDDESHVLELLTGLLDEERQQRSDESIAFYYRHRLDEKNENGSVNYHPLKIPFGDKSYIIHALRKTAANDEWGMEDKRFYVAADEYKLKNLSRRQGVIGQLHTLPATIRIQVSLRDIFVNKFDIKSLLSDNNLPVPQDWREMVVSGGGLTQSAQRATPDRDEEIGKRIQRVLEAGEDLRAKNLHLSIAGIANGLAKRDGTGKFEKYGDESIRKILSGTFDPANRRGIPGLKT